MYQIEVKDLCKKYKVYTSKVGRLKEWVLNKDYHNEFWALNNVNFTVRPGESIGFIGHNGAGKSTLLKLLTKTIHPTSGSIEVHGRVTALLELGMGFHPDFTGIQNIYMTGQLMGLSNEEISHLIPEIEDFAEIGEHIYQPIRTYSSGMTVRLGFSIATAIRPDILIVDEALSVGDAYFQLKCFKRIREYRESGTTLLFVSHDPGAVKNLCDRAILLDKGQQLLDGKPEDVLDYYNALLAKNIDKLEAEKFLGKGERRSGNNKAEIKKVFITKNDLLVNTIQVLDTFEINIEVEFKDNINNPTLGFVIKDRLGNEIFGTNTNYLEYGNSLFYSGERKVFSFQLKNTLGTGSYNISVAIHSDSNHINENYNWWDQAATLQVISGQTPYFIGVNYMDIKKYDVK